ncbi:hypothetical protein [Spirillospora sp. CA-128828]|uniref:hypothetical protein n=1 Tax=Spirillospora sp. CA-128828 TaxID=3240033 RepID=UPI003D8DB0F9
MSAVARRQRAVDEVVAVSGVGGGGAWPDRWDQDDGVVDEVVAQRLRRRHGHPPERDRLYEVYAPRALRLLRMQGALTHAAYIASSGAAVCAAEGIT